ncbi:MAG: tetratricopeptide repeat protein [Verrucomicrobia bacterium]|nr:tetratricopeptide repeat protein [Verrucomicrobiota bacterium]
MTPIPDLVNRLVAAARRIPEGAERTAFVVAECGQDSLLRQQVEMALAGVADALPGAEPDLAATVKAPGPAQTSLLPGDDVIGSRIGRYRLLQVLGEGGFGTVYVAEQSEPVVRRVALKIIKLGMDTREVVARFEAERQALAMMDHPNIAQVFDAGATESGRPYFVMELVKGIPLNRFCNQHRYNTQRRLKLFNAICSAVQHAHQKGIIHRDLKPSNILVTLQGDEAVPKVIDFGIAKAIDRRLTNKTVYTQDQQFLGTPMYMSPEQAGAGSLDVDTRSDIYSLGVVLYELLTDHPPFDSQSLARLSLEEIRRVVREREPSRPSTRLARLTEQGRKDVSRHLATNVNQLGEQLRGDLDWIVMKCLEKDRTRRYESVSGLAADLERYRRQEPVTARPPSRRYRLQKLVQRNRLAVGAGAAVALALLLGFALSTWLFLRERQALALATAAEQSAQMEAARSRQVALFLKRMLKGVGPATALGRDTQMLREILEKTAQQLGTELANQPEVEADLRLMLGQTYYDLGEYALAASMHAEALRLLEQRFGTNHPSLAEPLFELGRTRHESGDLDTAEPLYHRALSLRQRTLGTNHLDVARSLGNLANLRADRGDLPGAAEYQRQSLDIRERLLLPDDPQLALSYNNLAMILRDQGKANEALRWLEKSYDIRQRVLDPLHPDLAQSHINFTAVLADLNRFSSAETHLRKALELMSRVLPPEHPDLALGTNNLAALRFEQGHWTEAEELSRLGLERERRLRGDQHQETLYFQSFRGRVLLALDRLTEAQAILTQSEAGQTAIGETANSNLAATRLTLAQVHLRKGELDQARLYWEGTRKAQSFQLPAGHPERAALSRFQARLELASGKTADAAQIAADAAAALVSFLGTDDVWGVTEAKFLEGAARIRQRSDPTAEALFMGQADILVANPVVPPWIRRDAAQQVLAYLRRQSPEQLPLWQARLESITIPRPPAP